MLSHYAHPRFWYALIFELLERSRCQSVSPNNSAILLWNPVVLLDNVYDYSPNYCTLYHLVNSKAQKLKSNNQVRITFTIFGSRMRLASFTHDWLRRDLHVSTSSPGSSRFSIWRRLGRRPWHIADHVSPTRMEMYSNWRLRRKGWDELGTRC